MKKAGLVAARELHGLVVSGTGPVVGAIFLALSGWTFRNSVTGSGEAALTLWANDVQFFLLPLAAVLSMRTLAAEQRAGTIDLLLSAPLRLWQVVVGKYLGVLAFLGLLLAATLPYPVLLWVWARPPAGPLAGAYLGVLLFGAAALAVGVFASAATASQAVAALGSIAILTLFWFADSLAEVVHGAGVERVLFWASPSPYLEPFILGSLSLRGGAYYASFAAFWLAAAAQVLRRRL